MTSPSPIVKALEAELNLARKNELYFILDVGRKKISLKAKGILLKEWGIRKIRIWGIPFTEEPVSLIKKSTFFPPRRPKINPKKINLKKEIRLDTLELSDMPSYYSLSLENNINLYVKPPAKRIFSKIGSLFRLIKWFTLSPLKTVFFSLKKRTFSALEIELNSKSETQELYWTTYEGIKFLIVAKNIY